MGPYPVAVERMMKRLYRSLRENDRRRYAAIEATKLGHGGTEYIATLLGCDPEDDPPGDRRTGSGRRTRHPARSEKGGGRKRVMEVHPGVSEPFVEVLRDHTAGDPMNPELRWTNLSRRQIARRMKALGASVGRRAVSQLLHRHGYRRRKALKKKTMGRHPDRNAQFENITRLKGEYLGAGRPVLSIDTKKKELLGDFYRDGVIDARETITTNDHDFVSRGGGKVIPHGLYDVGRNEGFVHLNTSHDTSELACDSIAAWWEQHGRQRYPGATKLLLLCDGGGSNSATQYLFKQDLQELAKRLGLEIRVAHYPPYCSKYNPIEHRLFPHVSRACRGVVFHTLETVRHYMAKTETTTGLRVVVGLLEKVYATGRKCVAGFKKAMKLVFDPVLPKWNYTAIPDPP